jgi:hypothetical protein
LFLRAPFASAKSFALVKFFMVCPQWSADGLTDHDEILPPDHGHLMADIRNTRVMSAGENARGCNGSVR